jgi:hypothetical protein
MLGTGLQVVDPGDVFSVAAVQIPDSTREKRAILARTLIYPADDINDVCRAMTCGEQPASSDP